MLGRLSIVTRRWGGRKRKKERKREEREREREQEEEKRKRERERGREKEEEKRTEEGEGGGKGKRERKRKRRYLFKKNLRRLRQTAQGWAVQTTRLGVSGPPVWSEISFSFYLSVLISVMSETWYLIQSIVWILNCNQESGNRNKCVLTSYRKSASFSPRCRMWTVKTPPPPTPNHVAVVVSRVCQSFVPPFYTVEIPWSVPHWVRLECFFWCRVIEDLNLRHSRRKHSVWTMFLM